MDGRKKGLKGPKGANEGMEGRNGRTPRKDIYIIYNIYIYIYIYIHGKMEEGLGRDFSQSHIQRLQQPTRGENPLQHHAITPGGVTERRR